MPKDWIKSVMNSMLPGPARRWIQGRQHRLTGWPPVGLVRFGGFRRLTPISRKFGFERGLCVDRYYIETFLANCASDIRGFVLEMGDNTYTKNFGADRVAKSDVLHAKEGNANATMVVDLTSDSSYPSESFDCIIFTQTLQFIYDFKAALTHLHGMLKPGGVLLGTFSGISHISRYDMDRWGDYWRFTSLSARRLFEEIFPAANVTVAAHGNVLTAIALLHGLAAEELKQEELDHKDPDYELIITVRAVKSATTL